jgi:hypothetical protein
MTKQEIDYDVLKNGFKRIAEQNVSPSIGSTLAKVAFGGIFGTNKSLVPMPYPYPEPILLKLVGAAAKQIIEKFFSDPASFSDDDLKNIEHLIQEGRRQGLEEMEIRISKDLGAKIELSVNLPVENVPIGTSLNLERKNNGDYAIHVKFGNISHKDETEALQGYHNLLKDGILTKEEFEKKKTEILRTNQ